MLQTRNTWHFERLCALWVLAESGLGGWMHSLKIPLTGIFLGGASVVIMALLARNHKRPNQRILQAFLLVSAFKLLISPQAPIQAYFALSFQALCGMLFFSLISSFRLACMVTGFIALAESGAQKFLIASLWMGEDFWHALSGFAQQVGGYLHLQAEIATMIPWVVVAGWTLFHAFWGLAIGIWINRWLIQSPKLPVVSNDTIKKLYRFRSSEKQKLSFKRKNGLKWFFWLIPVLLTAWYSEHPLTLLGRLLLLPAIGLLIVFPLFKAFINNYRIRNAETMVAVEARFNVLLSEWPLAWTLSGIMASEGFGNRWSLILKMLLEEGYIKNLTEQLKGEQD